MIEITTHLAHPCFTGQRSKAEASWQGNGDRTVDETTMRGCSRVMYEHVGLGGWDVSLTHSMIRAWR